MVEVVLQVLAHGPGRNMQRRDAKWRQVPPPARCPRAASQIAVDPKAPADRITLAAARGQRPPGPCGEKRRTLARIFVLLRTRLRLGPCDDPQVRPFHSPGAERPPPPNNRSPAFGPIEELREQWKQAGPFGLVPVEILRSARSAPPRRPRGTLARSATARIACAPATDHPRHDLRRPPSLETSAQEHGRTLPARPSPPAQKIGSLTASTPTPRPREHGRLGSPRSRPSL